MSEDQTDHPAQLVSAPLYLADDPVEAGAVMALLEEMDIPFHTRPVGVQSALGQDPMAPGPVEIAVARAHWQKARAVIVQHGDGRKLAATPPENDGEPAQEKPWSREEEAKRRLRWAFIFLIPFLWPLSLFLVLANLNTVNGYLQFAEPGPETQRQRRWVRVGYGLLLLESLALVLVVIWGFLP